jgi:hypothetical protein
MFSHLDDFFLLSLDYRSWVWYVSNTNKPTMHLNQPDADIAGIHVVDVSETYAERVEMTFLSSRVISAHLFMEAKDVCCGLSTRVAASLA